MKVEVYEDVSTVEITNPDGQDRVSIELPKSIQVIVSDAAANGKSAYQIWLDLGNTGTEQDFIDSLGGVADEEWEELNLDGRLQGALALSQSPQFLASSVCRAYWQRVGRKLDMLGLMLIPANEDWGTPDPFFPIQPIILNSDELPYIPRIYPFIGETGLSTPSVGDFSIINTADSDNNPIADNSMAVGTVITNFGGSLAIPIFSFFHASQVTDGNLTNLVFDGNRIELIGNFVLAYFKMSYECAYELGYMNIADTFEDATEDEAYSQTVDVTTSSPFQSGLEVEVSEGALPTGLSVAISDKTITLSGTPATPGEYTFTLIVAAENGDTYSKEFTVTIEEAVELPTGIEITEDFTSPVDEDIAYSSSVAVVLEDSDQQLPITQNVISGNVPNGTSLSIDGSSLVLSGTPSDPAIYTFTVQITDALSNTYEREFTVEISDVYHPEEDALYLGTVSGNTFNINFVPPWSDLYGTENLHTWTAAHAEEGMILKIRSGTLNYDFGEGLISVPIDDYMIYEEGFWRHYDWE